MILNTTFIISGIIGFIISAILFINKKSNHVMNIYMILLIALNSFRFFTYGIINLISNKDVLTLYAKYSNLSTLIIPLAYLYFEKLGYKKSFEKKDLFHFVFPTVYFLITFEIYEFIIPNYTVKLCLYIVFMIYLTTYCYISYKVLQKTIWNKKRENKLSKNQYKKVYNWTLFLFIALVLASIRLILSLFIEFTQNEQSKGFSYQWITAVIWIVILIKILVSPEILYGYKILNEKVLEDRNSKLTFETIWKLYPVSEIKNAQHLVLKDKINQNLQNYFEIIEKNSLDSNLFRDATLTLNDFATKINIPKSHLSYVFKYHSTISFSEYKKTIRILDAVKLIDSGYLKNNTMDSLSKKIGFTSYNPFFTSFKEITGQAPVEYINSIKDLNKPLNQHPASNSKNQVVDLEFSNLN
ncbi:helix-turn-helix domain-containing protein [Flavobacterium flavipallidum]|uniref:Helix-turn-helix domain-containing protein n=1 Tax=Flavobacterium flavipallidum TaxID=3139140 RepID=A0ABU9HN46_9FLAO